MARNHGVVWLHRFVEHFQVSLIDPDGQKALPQLRRTLKAVPPPPTRIADLCARQLVATALLRMARKSPEVAGELGSLAANLSEGDWTTMTALLESLQVAPSALSSLAQRTRQYLDGNYSTPCRLVDVARSVGASTRLVTKEFSAEYGRSIHQYLIVIRVKAALDMLSSSDEKITAIASAVGFAHVSVLYRQFRALCGVSPGVFRGSRAEASAAKARIDSEFSRTVLSRP